MQIETIGHYQLHLVAHELPGATPRWDPFVSVHRFDDDKQDFVCVLEKQHAATEALPTYEAAIDAARQYGTAFIEARKA